MKKSILIILASLATISGCTRQLPNSDEITSNSDNTTSITTTTSTNTSEDGNTSTSKTNTTTSDTDKDIDEDGVISNKITLPCGYIQMDLPKNYNNITELKTTLSADSSSWSNNEFYDELNFE